MLLDQVLHMCRLSVRLARRVGRRPHGGRTKMKQLIGVLLGVLFFAPGFANGIWSGEVINDGATAPVDIRKANIESDLKPTFGSVMAGLSGVHNGVQDLETAGMRRYNLEVEAREPDIVAVEVGWEAVDAFGQTAETVIMRFDVTRHGKPPEVDGKYHNSDLDLPRFKSDPASYRVTVLRVLFSDGTTWHSGERSAFYRRLSTAPS